MSYEDYEKAAEITRSDNKILLEEFVKYLEAGGLKQKTVAKHVGNVDFYINVYLLYDDITEARDGVPSISGFFNWFLPKKAMWSSPSSVKENVTSLKKFYKYLSEKGRIDVSEYQFLLGTVKEEKAEWLEHYHEEW